MLSDANIKTNRKSASTLMEGKGCRNPERGRGAWEAEKPWVQSGIPKGAESSRNRKNDTTPHSILQSKKHK